MKRFKVLKSHEMQSRRSFLQGMVVGGVAFGSAERPGLCASRNPNHPELPSFDREMAAFMEPRGIPGGALAVVKDGRLVYAKGYGFADRERKIAATRETLFRIASISKPITGVAVMRLVQEGRLKLEDKAFDYIDLKPVVAFGKKPDPRLKTITIRQLLQHTGGWDRDASFDPMFRSDRIAEMVGVERPADAEAVIRYMLGQSLDFDPGTDYSAIACWGG